MATFECMVTWHDETLALVVTRPTAVRLHAKIAAMLGLAASEIMITCKDKHIISERCLKSLMSHHLGTLPLIQVIAATTAAWLDYTTMPAPEDLTIATYYDLINPHHLPLYVFYDSTKATEIRAIEFEDQSASVCLIDRADWKKADAAIYAAMIKKTILQDNVPRYNTIITNSLVFSRYMDIVCEQAYFYQLFHHERSTSELMKEEKWVMLTTIQELLRGVTADRRSVSPTTVVLTPYGYSELRKDAPEWTPPGTFVPIKG